jgi:hypothetical protein
MSLKDKIFGKTVEKPIVNIVPENTTWDSDAGKELLERLKKAMSPHEISIFEQYKQVYPGGGLGEYQYALDHAKSSLEKVIKKQQKKK